MLLALGLRGRPPARPAHGGGAGGRRRHGRRHRPPHGARSTAPAPSGSGPTSGAPTSSTPARPSTTCTAAPTARRSRSAPSSRSSSPPSLDVLGLTADSLPDQNDRSRWPELRAALTWAFAGRPPGRVARAGRGARRLPGARADHARGRRATRTSRARADHRRARRGAPAGARAAVLGHPGRASTGPPPCPASTPTRCCREWGFSAERGRRAARRRCRRLRRRGAAARGDATSDDVLETAGTRSTFRGRGPVDVRRLHG